MRSVTDACTHVGGCARVREECMGLKKLVILTHDPYLYANAPKPRNGRAKGVHVTRHGKAGYAITD
jgi:hypothetical protein